MLTENGTTFSLVDHGQLVRCRKCREILLEPRLVPSCDTSITATMAMVQRGGCHLCATGMDHQHFFCARCEIDTMVRHREVPLPDHDLVRPSPSPRRQAAATALLTAVVILAIAIPIAAWMLHGR